MQGVFVASLATNSGKTLLTAGLIASLRRMGQSVQPIKTGPDYLDAKLLALAADSPCLNLDPWAMRRDSRSALLTLRHNAAEGTEPFLCIEAATGLYDGARDGTGTSAELAQELKLPIILILCAKGQGATLALMARGIVRHGNKLDFAGYILNRVSNSGHSALIQKAMQRYLPELPCFGCVPETEYLQWPNRYLGLVQPEEHKNSREFCTQLADCIETYCDTVSIRQALEKNTVCNASLAEAMPSVSGSADGCLAMSRSVLLPPPGQHIAIARDQGFSFLYEAQLALWKRQACEISFFSPLADEPPPETADFVFLPGGYPELYAGRISAASKFRKGMLQSAQRGSLLYGECGGYMVLGKSIRDKQGKTHSMLGLLAVESDFLESGRQLGYRRVSAGPAFPFGKGEFTGHEFHYARVRCSDSPLFDEVSDANRQKIPDTSSQKNNVCGSFIHIIDRV